MSGGGLVISRVRLCLPLLVFANRCKAGKYQRYAFETHDQRSVGHQANQRIARIRAAQPSQAGCAVTLRLLVGFLWTSAPANAGLGLAPRIGRATGMTKRFDPECTLEQS